MSLAGVHRAVPQPGETPQQHVDLQLRALRRRGRGTLAQQSGQDLRGRAAQDLAGADLPLGVARPEGHLGGVPVRRHRRHLTAGEEFGAGRTGRVGQRGGERTHAAHGDIPVPGSAADHVVQEAAVLTQ
jgi:hypothetical protein